MLIYEFDQNNIPQPRPENPCATARFTIEEVTSGVREYVCGNFTNSHYSVLNMTVHSLLTEYRYRHITKSISEISEAEIYKMIFDPKSVEEFDSKEPMHSFVLKCVPPEVGLLSSENRQILSRLTRELEKTARGPPEGVQRHLGQVFV